MAGAKPDLQLPSQLLRIANAHGWWYSFPIPEGRRLSWPEWLATKTVYLRSLISVLTELEVD